ncbi:GcrA family cell cycle regulator [Phenylobacterium montanum]|uniref:GcrA cell cycle regulator n=1 Tax=Phenylobacterium montanum TaxID=2823693 RepID=A0A975IUS0_9CAUL|nr:GcrA family cell cycle regulator [Caulobacter sp. S6]QUD88035.1 hypothetical protein KCG34_23890 [Caulobacter sp. S6]
MSGPDHLSALGWTPDRVDLLRRHFAVGLTAAESAILLGVSKNAVISKRTRMGLLGGVRLFKAGEAAPQRRGREPRLKLTPTPQFRRLPLPDMDQPPPPAARPKPLAQRERGECAWPLGAAEQEGDWRTLFCCAPVRPGGRYCCAHAARARL